MKRNTLTLRSGWSYVYIHHSNSSIFRNCHSLFILIMIFIFSVGCSDLRLDANYFKMCTFTYVKDNTEQSQSSDHQRSTRSGDTIFLLFHRVLHMKSSFS